jgi:outer membrane protein OmpA-like peptidoglycan-associated protein
MTITIWKTIKIIFISVILFYSILLQGCASSAAQRGAASEADKAYLETSYQFTHSSGELRDAYQNSAQLTKGVLIGGTMGALAGAATSGGSGILPGFGLGAIFGGAIGAYIDSHTTLADKLMNRGVQVVQLGDQILIVIPSFILFDNNTSHLLAGSYETLDLVIAFINRYPNMSVKIAGYTSAIEPEDVSVMLSKQQAEKIMRYMWNRKLNTRLLFADGYGGCKLVTANTGDWGSDNYRIEITLEKLYV